MLYIRIVIVRLAEYSLSVIRSDDDLAGYARASLSQYIDNAGDAPSAACDA